MKKHAVEKALDVLGRKEARVLKGCLRVQKIFEGLPLDDCTRFVVEAIIDAEINLEKAIANMLERVKPKKRGGKRCP